MLYADGVLTEDRSKVVSDHLDICPVCRQTVSETLEVRAGLRQLRRPEVSIALKRQIKNAVTSEIRQTRRSWLPVSSEVRAWLQTRVMPYSVGVAASLLLGFTFLTMMFSGIRDAQVTAQNTGRTPTIMLNPTNGDGMALSASDYAKMRSDISSESPSINPQGALVALTKSFVRGGMKDDEVVVVADVFGNGLAQIAEVVEPSKDRRAVHELEKALDSDPAYAPFVAANLDKRSDSVRVILKFQSVNVPTNITRRKRR